MKTLSGLFAVLIVTGCGIPVTTQEISVGKTLSLMPDTSVPITTLRGDRLVFHADNLNLSQGDWKFSLQHKENPARVPIEAERCSEDSVTQDVAFCAPFFDLADIEIFQVQQGTRILTATSAFVEVENSGTRRITLNLF